MAHRGERTARLAGALWLIVIVAGVLGVVTQSGLPRVAFSAMPLIVPIAIVGEGALTFWLLVKGANVPEVSR